MKNMLHRLSDLNQIQQGTERMCFLQRRKHACVLEELGPLVGLWALDHFQS